MRLNISDLLAEPQAVRVLPFCEWLELPAEEARLLEPVTGEVTLTGTGRTVYLSGRLHTAVELVCGACLGAYRHPLEFPVAEEFGPAGPAGEEKRGEQELGPADFVVPLAPGDLVDLTEVVRQHLLLALPIAPRCREDCRGLCPRCGANLNAGRCTCEEQDVDPRLLPLLDWSPLRGGPPQGAPQREDRSRPRRKRPSRPAPGRGPAPAQGRREDLRPARKDTPPIRSRGRGGRE